MKILAIGKNKYMLEIDDRERDFLLKEAENNELTVIEILEMVMGVLFVGGYSNLVGKG